MYGGRAPQRHRDRRSAALPSLVAYTEGVFVRVISIVVAAVILAAPLSAQAEEQLIADIRMFTVMAAINAAGYDDGLSAEADHPARKALRQELESVDSSMRNRLRTYYEQHKLQDSELDLSHYISFALMCGEPPFFDLRAEVPTDLPLDVRSIRGLSALLREFYEVADIEGLWQRYLPAYEEAMLRYQDPLIESVFEINGYLRVPPASREGARLQGLLRPARRARQHQHAFLRRRCEDRRPLLVGGAHRGNPGSLPIALARQTIDSLLRSRRPKRVAFRAWRCTHQPWTTPTSPTSNCC